MDNDEKRGDDPQEQLADEEVEAVETDEVADGDEAGTDTTDESGSAEETGEESFEAEAAEAASRALESLNEAGDDAIASIADETVLLDAVAEDASLTRELPGKGSSPAMDKTVMFGETPHPVPPTEPQKPRRKVNRTLRNALVIALIVVVAGGGAAGYRWWQDSQAEGVHVSKSAARTMLSVTLPVSVPGLDADKGTKVPIEVEGQDASGNLVNEVLYVDQSGKGIKLLPGSYSFSAAASPIASDGTVYRLPKGKIKADISQDDQDLSDAGKLTFTVPSADSVTDGQISAAYKYAEQGGCSSKEVAAILKDAATQRRDAAVNAIKSRKQQTLQEADARHKATNLYDLDIPVEWYGKVATWQNGNTLCIYLAGDAKTPIVTLTAAATGKEFTSQDGDSLLGSVDLGNGYTVYASGPAYAATIADTVNGRTDKSVSAYSMDTAEELVELVTGSHYTYDQIKGDLVVRKGDTDGAVKLEGDYLEQILLPSIKARS